MFCFNCIDITHKPKEDILSSHKSFALYRLGVDWFHSVVCRKALDETIEDRLWNIEVCEQSFPFSMFF